MTRILATLFVVFIFASCKKSNDYVFDQSPDERINAALASYNSKLTTAENGWKATITVNNGNGATYSFYFKFNPDNRVKMFSDFDSTSAVTLQESSYRLKAAQQVTLIFDTYSYVHVLADPNEDVLVLSNVNGGPVGVGLISDFEFTLDDAKVKQDTIELSGKVNRSKLVLVRATKAEADAYSAGQLSRGLSINRILTYFKRLTVGSVSADVQLNSLTRTAIFTWIDGSGATNTFTTNYYYTIEGISFTKPVKIGTQTITTFTNMTFNTVSQSVDLRVNNQTGTIAGIVVPIKVDVGAPKRWYDQAVSADSYWYSSNGFHINGVDDGYNVRSLTSGGLNYYYYIYFPQFGTGNDFFGPIFLNATATGVQLVYGTAPRTPTFTADGRAVFTQLGNYNPHPTTGPAVQTRANLYTSRGFYFVQTGTNTYDMVSATDGKSWITWEM